MNGLKKCDRCPASARHEYQSPREWAGLVLAFCGHHSTKYGPALDQQGWRIKVLEGASK